jgi:hypothetical protein
MLCTAELDMAKTVTPYDVDVFLDNEAWAICSTYHTVLKASPDAAIFGCNMLFNILFIANWNIIGDYRQRQTDLNTALKNSLALPVISYYVPVGYEHNRRLQATPN